MFYPFRFKSILKEKIWGGDALQTVYGKEASTAAKIGESWEISAVPKNESEIINGSMKGKSLSEIIHDYKDVILGTKVFNKSGYEFPLLVKFLASTDKLSVQVHPSDEYAKEHYNSLGKTEIWIVLDAEEDAKIIAGLKEKTTEADMRKALEEKKLGEYMEYVPVKKGDVALIPAGRVHAMLEGTVIAEIQETSDLTFRLYDWDRVDDNGNARELHIDESMKVIKWDDNESPILGKVFEKFDGYECAKLINCEYFTIEEYINESETSVYKSETNSEESFVIIMALEGSGEIEHEKGSEPIEKGYTYLLPAGLGEYSVKGKLSFLKVFV